MRDKATVAGDHMAAVQHRYGDLQIPARRRAVVIGSDGADNIGSFIAADLVAAGFDVSGGDRDDLDVSNLDQLAYHDWSDVDTLVLANGFSQLDWLENGRDDDIVRAVGDNLVGSMFATRKFVRETLDAPHLKHLVFIGSMAHRAILNASSYYCGAKAGLAHFARCAAWELTPKGYRVFTVHPSNTEGTPMTEKTVQGIEDYRGISREEAEAYWGAINLMPRWLGPHDIGEVVSWLCTNDAAQYLSGSDIELKAGQR